MTPGRQMTGAPGRRHGENRPRPWHKQTNTGCTSLQSIKLNVEKIYLMGHFGDTLPYFLQQNSGTVILGVCFSEIVSKYLLCIRWGDRKTWHWATGTQCHSVCCHLRERNKSANRNIPTSIITILGHSLDFFDSFDLNCQHFSDANKQHEYFNNLNILMDTIFPSQLTQSMAIINSKIFYQIISTLRHQKSKINRWANLILK